LIGLFRSLGKGLVKGSFHGYATHTMLDPHQLLSRLDALGIAHRTVEHPPVFTVEEAKAAARRYLPGGHIKNLFLRNRKEEMWLVVALEENARSI
jgi:Ala-tRNA(Pro) deacylase